MRKGYKETISYSKEDSKNFYDKMTTYYQILIRGKPMRPTQGVPYEFKTYQEALDMVDMCYGRRLLGKDIEIVEINPYIKMK